MGRPTVLPRLLTKSLFKTYLSCPRKLYYTLNPTQYKPTQFPQIMHHLAKESEFLHEKCASEVEGLENASNLPPSVVAERINRTTISASVSASASETETVTTTETATTATVAADTSFTSVCFSEATLTHSRLLCRVDVLKLTAPAALSLCEIKSKSYSSTSPKFYAKRGGRQEMGNQERRHVMAPYKPYVMDVAFQYYVAEKIFPGHTITPYLIMPDTSKSFDGSTVGSITTAVDVKDAVVDIVTSKEFEFDVAGAMEIIEDADNIDKARPNLSSKCKECPFYDEYINQCIGTPEAIDKSRTPLTFTVRGSGSLDINALLANSKFFLKDLNPGHDYLTPNVKFYESGFDAPQLNHFQCQSPSSDRRYYTNRAFLRPALSKFKFPLHFIDFETAQPAVPLCKGQRPYETLPFQYSHHILHEDGSLTHTEYLDTSTDNPQIGFSDALKSALSVDDGSVIHWGAYEKTILKKLEVFANHDVFDRLIDLSAINKKGWYGVDTNGSNSLKHVLKSVIKNSEVVKEIYEKPYGGTNFKNWVWYREKEDGKGVIDPYKLLSSEGVSDGAGAAASYVQIRRGEVEREEEEKMLKMYCELDTLGTVIVYQALAGFLEEEEEEAE